MNIVFVTPKLTLGGYEKVVVNYANAFSRLGHNIKILCGFREGEYLKQLSSKITVIGFDARLREFVTPLARFLKENEVDILYVPYRSYTCVAVLAKWISGNKNCVIYGTAHGYGSEPRLMEWIEGRLIKRADVLSAVTKELAEFESKALSIPIKRYIYLNNPVIDSHILIKKESHQWLGENKSCPVLISSGRIEQDKRTDVAIRILKELLKYINVKMLVLGEGSQLSTVKNLVKELAVDKNIDFLGYVSNPMGYMSQCDIFLHTAEIEAFGNVIIEALYCDLPIVTTDCKGPVELIEQEKYGTIIGKWDDNNIDVKGAAAILDILQGKKKYTGMKEKALQYDAQNLEKQFLEPYYEQIK